MTNKGDIASYALEYHRRGWKVVELRPNTKKPIKDNWPELEYSEKDLETIFSNGSRNLGVILGSVSGNLVDVDIDDPYVFKIINYLPYTGLVFGRVSSPNSHHLYILTDEIIPGRYIFADPLVDEKDGNVIIELRSNGGQTMFPPSIHPSGEIVTWYEYAEISTTNYASLYNVCALLASATLLGKYWPKGSRHNAIGALAGGLARSNWTLTQARWLCKLVLLVANDEEIEDRLRYVEDTYTTYEENRVNVTGFTRLNEYIDSKVVNRIIKWLNLVEEPIGHNATDSGNAERIIDKFGSEFFFHKDMDEFFVWNGVYWELDQKSQIREMARETIREIPQEAKHVSQEQFKTIVRFALQSENTKGLDNALKETSKTKDKVKLSAELDTDPNLFTVQNGTIDLTTGNFYTSRKDDYITKCSPVTFDSEAKCPLWTDFISTTFNNNQQLIQYVQTALGSSLTGIVKDKAFFICYGETNTGKSTLLDTILRILGDYGMQISQELITKNSRRDSLQELAFLHGKRFALASEPTDGLKLNDALIKAMTGGNVVQGRFMYKKLFTFHPTHKLWIDTNFAPNPSMIDDAIWNRSKYIIFDVHIPKDKQDLNLKEKFWHNERSGILNWLVQGSVNYNQNGLIEPVYVQEQTQHVRDEMNALGKYVKEDYVITNSKDDKIPVEEFRNHYVLWCEREGIFEVQSSGQRQQFNKEMKKLGLEQIKWRYYAGQNSVMCWYGIRRKRQDEE